MLHSKRTWCIAPVSDAEELARKLTELTWTGCTAFELEGYLFLNDSTSLDGAQEYAVLKRPAPGEAFFQIVKLRRTRQRGELPRSRLTPAMGGAGRWVIEGLGNRSVIGGCHEVSAAAGLVAGIAKSAWRSAVRFQGKNGWMS